MMQREWSVVSLFGGVLAEVARWLGVARTPRRCAPTNSMIPTFSYSVALGILVIGCLGVCGTATAAAPLIPAGEMAAVEASFATALAGRSEARQRLSLRRVVRSGEALLDANATAPNRFVLLGTLYRARMRLLDLDGAAENREALLVICRKLVDAPNEYAAQRFDADLLLSQTEQARKGTTPTERVGELRSFIARYRDTSVESKMLQVVTMMTLELGNDALLFDLRHVISERYWNDLEMVRFKRDNLGGQVMSAPFHARLKASDGSTVVFPMDRLGRSTIFFVWSKDTEDLDERIAKWNTFTGAKSGPKDASITHIMEKPEHLDIVSLNLDELPDAGASILREKGVDWQALHLPGGRNSEIYKTYIRWDPMGLHVSPTGCAALLLPGLHSHDYPRRVWSYMVREDFYLRQLQSLFMGEFLVVDPLGDFDRLALPELKFGSPQSNKAVLFARSAASVPTNLLHDIQSCFLAANLSSELSQGAALNNYQRAEGLCRKALAAHPKAPDLWLVHNRLIMSLVGQWRLSCDPSFLTRAGQAAEKALAAESPVAAQVVPRLCMARLTLRDPAQDPATVIKSFVDACGGESNSAAAVAAACYLALDVGSRDLHVHYRRLLLDGFENIPSVWPVTSALLDRFHRFQLFYHPYRRGWSFGRRAARYYNTGVAQDAKRSVQADFKTLEGKTFSVPNKDGAKWNVLYFAARQVEGARPTGDMAALNALAAKRDPGEVKIWNVSFSDDAKAVAAGMTNTLQKQTLLVPGGLNNPMVQRLGIFQGGEGRNMAIIRGDGSISVMVSALAWHGTRAAYVLQSALEISDEAAVDAALGKGDTDTALRLALRWAPVVIPDPKARRRPAGPSVVHLRCRAKAYIAMRNWKQALPDVDLLVDRHRRADAHMSVESPDLLVALALQAKVHERLVLKTGQGENK